MSEVFYRNFAQEMTRAEFVDPERCPHVRVNRVLNRWKCDVCGAEFAPVNPKHRTISPLGWGR